MKVSKEQLKSRNKGIFLYLIKLHKKEMNRFPEITTIPYKKYKGKNLLFYTNLFDELSDIEFILFDKFIIRYDEDEEYRVINLHKYTSVMLHYHNVRRFKVKADVIEFLINN